MGLLLATTTKSLIEMPLTFNYTLNLRRGINFGKTIDLRLAMRVRGGLLRRSDEVSVMEEVLFFLR